MASRSGAEELAGAKAALGWNGAAFDVPETIRKAWARAGRRGRREHKAWRKRLEALAPDRRRRVRAAHQRRGAVRARRGDRRAQGSARRRAAGGRDPQGERDRARGRDRGGARARARLGRPDAVEQHQDQEPDRRRAGPIWRALHPFRHPRARHGGGHERACAPWRLPPGRRDVPGLHRLCAAGDPHRGAVRHPGDLRHDARLRSASARTDRRISRSSILRP